VSESLVESDLLLHGLRQIPPQMWPNEASPPLVHTAVRCVCPVCVYLCHRLPYLHLHLLCKKLRARPASSMFASADIVTHTTHTTGDTQVESGRSLFAFLSRAILSDPSDVMQKMTVRWNGECSHRHITHTLREWITRNGD
jgi:hypothetical protein